MPLKGKKPDQIQKRFKAFFYGAAGVGKTTAAINFPAPYVIDAERGAENSQYVDTLGKNGGVIFQTSDFDEVMEEVICLLSEEHEYRTLVIDPLTAIYNDLLVKEEKKHGDSFGRHYQKANVRMIGLFNLLLRLDMNVILTSHAKNEYGPNLEVIGKTFNCYKDAEYLFDLSVEVQKQGKNRVGFIKKTRVEGFPEGEKFDFSYSEISKRYGKELLEKKSQNEILASSDQVKEINRLIQLLNVPEEVYGKWLSKSGSKTFSHMPADNLQKCIDMLVSKLKGEDK